MGISASSELGRAILRQRPDLLASTTQSERAAKREALSAFGYTFRSKAELAYAHRLEAARVAGVCERWDYEAVAFRLKGGKVYWCDFRTVARASGRDSAGKVVVGKVVEYHEVKAGRKRHPQEREGMTKLEWAAQRYPEECFVLARLERGNWSIEGVKS